MERRPRRRLSWNVAVRVLTPSGAPLSPAFIAAKAARTLVAALVSAAMCGQHVGRSGRRGAGNKGGGSDLMTGVQTSQLAAYNWSRVAPLLA